MFSGREITEGAQLTGFNEASYVNVLCYIFKSEGNFKAILVALKSSVETSNIEGICGLIHRFHFGICTVGDFYTYESEDIMNNRYLVVGEVFFNRIHFLSLSLLSNNSTEE